MEPKTPKPNSFFLTHKLFFDWEIMEVEKIVSWLVNYEAA